MLKRKGSESRRPQRSLLWLCVLGGLALVAAACGNDDAVESADPTVAPEVAADDTAADDAPAVEEEAPSEDPPPTDAQVVLTDDFSVQHAEWASQVVDTSEFKTEPPYRIATIVQGPTNGWGAIFDTVMNYTLEQSGLIEDQFYVPWDFTTESQANGIEDAIAQDVDIILLTALSRAGLTAPVERAVAAGIPVVTCMATVDGDAPTIDVSQNIPLQGYETATRLAEEIGGSGKIVLLHGIAGVDAAEFWRSGALAAFAEYPDIEIVAEEYGNWSVSDSLEVMRPILIAQSEIDGVWVGGFEMGFAVVTTFEEAGRPVPPLAGTAPINGFDRLAIENDVNFSATTFSPASAKLCVETLFDVLDGEPVPRFVDVTTALEGTSPYASATAGEPEAHYRADFNDDWIGPAVVPDEVYLDAGFGR